MIVTNLYEYPVKGLLGHEINCASVNRRGLGMDRRWMLIDDEGNFLSQRQLSALTQFLPEYQNELTLKHLPTAELKTIDTSEFNELLNVNVWGQECTAHGSTNDIDKWLSDKLETSVKLVHMDDNDIRPVKSSGTSDIVSFADAYPVLLASNASLTNLNKKLPESIGINRFRPNILIDGEAPHAEDNWTSVKIGEVTFRVEKQCARCNVINIDQQTGLSSKEPLKTLSTYRRDDNKVTFGVYLTPVNEGIIHEGDDVIILG